MAFAVVHSQDSPAKTPNYAKNGKNNMKEFIALHNRTVSRDEIQTVIALAKEQNNTEVIYRLSKILNDHPDSNRFNINIINYPQETTQQVALAGARHSGDYREALDECGRLKKGWHFVDGKVVKVQKRSGLLSQYTEKEFGHPFTKTLKAKFKELNWKYDRKNKRYYTPVPENEAEKEQHAQMFAFIEQEKATLEVNKPEKSPKTPTDKSAPSDLSSNKNIFLEEYRQLKAKYPEHLIIVSMEDHQNYCMYGKDAVIAADILNLQLLKGKRNDEFSNSVGFKYNYLREYLEKLVKAGYKVAVRENNLAKPFRKRLGFPSTLFGTLPTFKTRKEAKKYFKAWAAENLTGKKVYHKELDKYVVFSSRGIDHVLSSNISFNKMKLILQAEEMLKNSHLIAFEEDYKKRENIKGVYRMRSNAVLEGEDIKVILTLREGENGVIYYDHKIEEIKESTTPPRKSLANPFCGDSAPTNTPAKTVPNSALSAPRHAGILKEALTEKGKLKKGWYFQDYGIIDPKGKYHPLERDYSLEYNLIEKELRDRAFQQDEKRKIKGFEENKKLEEAIKVFLKELSKENKKHFKNSKAMEVFYWAFPFTLERNSTFYTFEESNPYINKNLQELDKYFSDDNELFERLENYETLRRYRLKSLGLHISTKISSFIDKQGKVIRGDSNKLNQKYGLSAPEVFVEHSPDPATQSAPSITPRNNSLANRMLALQNRTFETFIIAEPQMQAFLGDVERKNTGSTAITITGGAGSGKTRFAFQFINALAQNYKVGHASLEEQPDSKLYFDKVQQYLDQTAQANVEAPEIENMQDLQALIERNDVIVIDSFTKIREWDRNFLLDRDLRKKYNGKLFLIIFQQTVAGNMRGGTTSEFDGDIILYTQVFPDYRENYIYPSKNRYNSTPSEQLRYSVYHQQLLPSESTPPDSSPVTSNTYEVIY